MTKHFNAQKQLKLMQLCKRSFPLFQCPKATLQEKFPSLSMPKSNSAREVSLSFNAQKHLCKRSFPLFQCPKASLQEKFPSLSIPKSNSAREVSLSFNAQKHLCKRSFPLFQCPKASLQEKFPSLSMPFSQFLDPPNLFLDFESNLRQILRYFKNLITWVFRL